MTHSGTLGTCAPLGKLMLNMWSTHCTAKELIKEKGGGSVAFGSVGLLRKREAPPRGLEEYYIFFNGG